MVLAGPGTVRILLTALLLSNLRATWIASLWKPESDEAVLPPRFAETWSDKFADQLPRWLWPKVKVQYRPIIKAVGCSANLQGDLT
jgi:hypothetical protein